MHRNLKTKAKRTKYRKFPFTANPTANVGMTGY
jgi:hypothetical protein